MRVGSIKPGRTMVTYDSWTLSITFMLPTSGSLINSCRFRTVAPSSMSDSLLQRPPPLA